MDFLTALNHVGQNLKGDRLHFSYGLAFASAVRHDAWKVGH